MTKLIVKTCFPFVSVSLSRCPHSATLDSDAYKALLSIGVVAAAALVALILAKCASFIYDRKVARKKERAHVDAESTDLVRARLAVMQFKRYRMGTTDLTSEESALRKTLGIWSYKGGKTQGPLKPPQKKPEPPREPVSPHVGKDARRERAVAEKAEVSNILRVSGDTGPLAASPAKVDSNQTKKESGVPGSVTAKVQSEGAKTKENPPVKNSTKTIDQVQLVSEVNKKVSVKPQPGLVLKLNHSNHNKVGAAPPTEAPASAGEEPPTPGTSRDINSQSSSHETGDSARHTPSSPSTPGKHPGSSRKLFTIVTSSKDHEKRGLKRQESTMSAKAVKRVSAGDTQSMKSEPGVRDTERNPGVVGQQAPPPKRPTTSHLSSRPPPQQKSQSAVGVSLLNSDPGKQAANEKPPAAKVKVKPNTGVGVANNETSKPAVATAGSKS
ncbi:hypothetical protein PoB_006947800 [Plakobranchus ocellatus]|uniref:Uncharacterized protein n=1 Tax=Plakobranchus ocellatus TaxID=259542 RepID=A0AAV4DFG9_9GAST|nr:hypothetical protein PoB_006947800 [Plakobranchus ocellatus]